MRRGPDLLTGYGIAFIIFLYGPLLLMAMFSFNDSIFAVFPIKGFTTKAYHALANTPALHHALWNSLKVAIVVSVVSTLFGLLAALAVTRFKLPGSGPVMGAIMVPLVIPVIILGIGLLIVIRKVLGFELGLWAVGSGHVLLCIPYCLLTLVSRLEGFDKSLNEASADLGERPMMTFWRVTLPLALPGIVSSLLLAFTVSFDEFVLAVFLSGTESTLPVYLWGALRFPNQLPGLLALGTTILVVSTIIVVTSELLRRRGMQPGDKEGI
ncbi:MAG: ABC transporter permease [Hyphomicrobiaceae bacterium]